MATNSLEDLLINNPELIDQMNPDYNNQVDLGTVDINKALSTLTNPSGQNAPINTPKPSGTSGSVLPSTIASKVGQGLKDFMTTLGQSAAGSSINMQRPDLSSKGWETSLAANLGSKLGAGLIATALTGKKSGQAAAEAAKPDLYNTPEQIAQQQRIQQAYQARTEAAQQIKGALQAPIVAAKQAQQENLRQDRLEKIYGDRLAKITSNRSGGLGLQDAKVNQAIHLRSLVNQFYDPTTKSYNIPSAQYTELALGLASLVSNSQMALESTLQGIQTRTLAGDTQGALTYVLGLPRNANTQAIMKNLVSSIDRQGTVAEGLRNKYLEDFGKMAPKDLAPDRKDLLHQINLGSSFNDVLSQSPDKVGGTATTSGASGAQTKDYSHLWGGK